jgi:hypothetical protein
MLKELQEWIKEKKNICNPKVVKCMEKDTGKEKCEEEKKSYIKKERKGKKYYIVRGLKNPILKGKNKKKMSKEEKNEIKARSLQDRIILYWD